MTALQAREEVRMQWWSGGMAQVELWWSRWWCGGGRVVEMDVLVVRWWVWRVEAEDGEWSLWVVVSQT